MNSGRGDSSGFGIHFQHFERIDRKLSEQALCGGILRVQKPWRLMICALNGPPRANASICPGLVHIASHHVR